MKKKGFTLVELLAVIAILALLVIVAVPNIIGLFTNAKKSTFTTEVRNVYKMAVDEWAYDQVYAMGDVTYTNMSDVCSSCDKLSGDFRDKFQYTVTIDIDGNVKELYVTDGSYEYSYNRDIDGGEGLERSNIKEDNVVAVGNGNNIPRRGTQVTPGSEEESEELTPVRDGFVTVKYYFNNAVVKTDIFNKNDSSQSFASYKCENNGDVGIFNYWYDSSNNIYYANQDVPSSFFENNSGAIDLTANCTFNKLTDPRTPVSY